MPTPQALGSVVPHVSQMGMNLLIVLVVTFLTEVTSNTATANIMMPIMASVAFDTLTNPLLLMLPVAVACSFAFMLPAATPPNSVVFATRRVSIFDFVKAGLVLNVVGALAGGVLLFAMATRSFDASSPFPEWACNSAQEPKQSECVWVSAPGVVRGVWQQHQGCVPLLDEPAALTAGTPLCRLLNGSLLAYSPVTEL